MTREDEIQARLEAATPGEWTVRTSEWVDGGVHCKSRRIEGSHHGYDFPDDTPEGALANADVALIVNAKTDLQYLLDENARLREQLQGKATDAAAQH